MSAIIAALVLGLAGSFHCVGMCGPIALALPVRGKAGWQRAGAVLLYNLGRVLTYALMGLLFGLLGKGFALAGIQQVISVVAGLVILVSILIPLKYKPTDKFFTPVFGLSARIRGAFKKLFSVNTRGALFFIGLLNGLLPCGLVYVAVAGALVSGNALHGAAFMAVFGLGTVPVMMSVNLAKDLIGMPLRNKMRKVVPYFVSIMAIMLLLRGLNLGIPYVSPSLDKREQKLDCCTRTSSQKNECPKNSIK